MTSLRSSQGFAVPFDPSREYPQFELPPRHCFDARRNLGLSSGQKKGIQLHFLRVPGSRRHRAIWRLTAVSFQRAEGKYPYPQPWRQLWGQEVSFPLICGTHFQGIDHRVFLVFLPFFCLRSRQQGRGTPSNCFFSWGGPLGLVKA